MGGSEEGNEELIERPATIGFPRPPDGFPVEIGTFAVMSSVFESFVKAGHRTCGGDGVGFKVCRLAVRVWILRHTFHFWG